MPASDGLVREVLVSLLVDLPGGAHARVLLGDRAWPETLEGLAIGADATGAQLLVHAAPEALRGAGAARLDRFEGPGLPALLEELGAAARAQGFAGVVVAVDAAHALAGRPAAHVAAEASLGPRLGPHVRVLCCYTPGARRLLGPGAADTVARHHSHTLPGVEGA